MAERNEKKKKKKREAELEMGYCPIEHWLGTRTGVGVGMSARGARRTALGAQHAGARR